MSEQTEIGRLWAMLKNLEARVAKGEEEDVANVYDLPTGLTEGDLLIVDGSGDIIRLAVGTQDQLLRVDSSRPDWQSFDWDSVSAAAAADMVHSHQSNAEGGSLAIAAITGIPGTIATILTDHTKAIHDALALDHGALSGKSDDDHTQYLLASGARVGAASQDQKFTNDVRALRGLWVGADSDPDDNDVHMEGSVNKSTTLGAMASRSSNQNIASSATWTSLSFDTQEYDTDGCFAATDTKLHARRSGQYKVGGTVNFAANSTGIRAIRIALNGTTYYFLQFSPAVAVYDHALTTGGVINMVNGDYIEVDVFQSSGGALNAVAAANYKMLTGFLSRIP